MAVGVHRVRIMGLVLAMVTALRAFVEKDSKVLCVKQILMIVTLFLGKYIKFQVY